jgi:hypothetical protein
MILHNKCQQTWILQSFTFRSLLWNFLFRFLSVQYLNIILASWCHLKKIITSAFPLLKLYIQGTGKVSSETRLNSREYWCQMPAYWQSNTEQEKNSALTARLNLSVFVKRSDRRSDRLTRGRVASTSEISRSHREASICNLQLPEFSRGRPRLWICALSQQKRRPLRCLVVGFPFSARSSGLTRTFTN